MGHTVRVFHIGSVVIGREHRRDEFETGDSKNPSPGLGAAAYTDANTSAGMPKTDLAGNPVNPALVEWFVHDEDHEYEAGKPKTDANWMPLEVWSCANPDAPRAQRICSFDLPKLALIRQKPINQAAKQARMAELLAIPRSDWTAAQMREILQLVAQELIP